MLNSQILFVAFQLEVEQHCGYYGVESCSSKQLCCVTSKLFSKGFQQVHTTFPVIKFECQEKLLDPLKTATLARKLLALLL